MRLLFILTLIVCLLSVALACGGKTEVPAGRAQPGTRVITPSEERASAAQPDPTPRLTPTPYASAMPLPTPQGPLIEAYIIQPGDTLSGISVAFDVPVEELVSFNGLGSESAIIHIGQTLQIPLNVSRSGPSVLLLPDSEVVYSPAYLNFDVQAFIARQGGYLAALSAPVDGVRVSGADIVSRVARQESVGPRVLLALLEHYGGWVTEPQPQSYQPLGASNPFYEEDFFLQLRWAANRVSEGYYSYKRDGEAVVRFSDGGRALLPSGLNAGTAGVQNILAINADWDTWQTEHRAFVQTYHRLFGDPFLLAFEPLIPIHLTQPKLQLPWEPGETFYLTGGPHAAFGSRSAWAAVDFAPPDIMGSCYYSQTSIAAAADGRVILGEPGEMYLDLDADGDLQTGWVLLYLHVVPRDDVTDGQLVSSGAPLGYASCEGGISTSSHLHFARRYNGEWVPADGPLPMELSGWRVKAGVGQYDGSMTRDGVTKTACECSDPVVNAIVGD